jgi:class 3 adenylate cyclase
MNSTPRRRAYLPLLFGAALAISIFLLDTISPLQIAVAVLYVVVILIAATYLQRRGVLIVSAACCALTIASYFLMHGFRFDGTAHLRACMSVAAIVITTVLALMNQSANERLRAAERERANLARFFPPQLVNQLVETDVPLSIARYQPAAILFVDMVGFSTYSSTKSPDAVIAFLRKLLSVLGGSVFANGGIIDKYLGDGLMAVFGPPLQGPEDATNAARCAFDILRAIDAWNNSNHRTRTDAIRVAIGIHYGDVVQGDVGNDNQLELTVVGDAVNIASHVEADSRRLGADILVTADFVAALHAEGSRDIAERFADQGYHLLRGRSEPTRLYGFKAPTTACAESTPTEADELLPARLARSRTAREVRFKSR